MFGLEEKDSALDTKSDVEKLFHHLVGRDVRIKDPIRLGRGSRNGDSSVLPHPRLLLLKLMCPWDCRIVLASKHKLRGYAGGHIFIHPDRSPEERQKEKEKWQKRQLQRQQCDHSREEGARPVPPTTT